VAVALVVALMLLHPVRTQRVLVVVVEVMRRRYLLHPHWLQALP
jgi:hypothetical protein